MKNIFVIGLDDFNLHMLKSVRGSEHYRFHGLLDYNLVVNPDHYPILEMIDAGKAQLDEFDGRIDAIINHWDFPSSALLPIFRKYCGLPTPTLSSVLISEHKYWSRLREHVAIPEHVPPFEAVDPFDDNAVNSIGLDYPFWLKPVIAFSSQLAFKVRNRADLDEALAKLRRGIDRFGEPFGVLLDKLELPADIPLQIDGYHAIAETAINGDLCTAEGYTRRGETHVYGIIDSYREGWHGSSFSRYQLPATVPESIQQRIVEATQYVIPQLGLDETAFNIEYFWDAEIDRIWLLEVNTRISKSHSPLFLNVSGSSNHEVPVEISLGREPDYPRAEGCCAVSAKFMCRVHYLDARVTRVPSAEELHALEAAYPGTFIEIAVQKGQWLSELRGQDAYSYEVAAVYMGADTTDELLKNYDDLKMRLPLEYDQITER